MRTIGPTTLAGARCQPGISAASAGSPTAAAAAPHTRAASSAPSATSSRATLAPITAHASPRPAASTSAPGRRARRPAACAARTTAASTARTTTGCPPPPVPPAPSPPSASRSTPAAAAATASQPRRPGRSPRRRSARTRRRPRPPPGAPRGGEGGGAGAEQGRGLPPGEGGGVGREQRGPHPADHGPRPAEPGAPPREPQQQAAACVLPGGARIAGLDDVAELEAGGGGDAARQAGGDLRGPHWEDARMSPRTWTALAALGAAGWSAPALAPLVPGVSERLRVHRRLSAAAATVHLTFDDGPPPQGTPAVLEALATRGATATFFLVGEQVERHPALAAEIAGAGHVVALHGYRHRCQLRVGPRALADDLRRATDAIGTAAGGLAPLYRPPYGIFSPAGLVLARRRGDAPWLWSRWGRDWRADATPDSVAALAAGDLEAGDVLLLHDADHYGDPGCWQATAGAVPLILDAAAERGLRAAAL